MHAFPHFCDPIRILRDIEISDAQPDSAVTLPSECTGMSGDKFRSYVKALMKESRGSYLEVGTWRGFTILSSAISNPSKPHLGVDNFSQFDDGRVNKAIFEAASEGLSNVQLFDMHYEDFFQANRQPLAKTVGVYFFDASHDYRSQYIGLGLAKDLLMDGAIVLVDDANYHHVRYACYDFMDLNPDFQLIGEFFTGTHPGNMTPEQNQLAKKTWWNGCIIMCNDPSRQLGELTLKPQKTDEQRRLVTVNLIKGHCGFDSSKLINQFINP
jgi:hypothetical protein